MKAQTLACAVLVAACGRGIATPMPGTPTTPVQATPTVPSPTPAAVQTATATVLEGVPATIVPLGADSTPIDLAFAFGSIWVASHHRNEVIRIDPTTLEVLARVEVGNGPGWLAVTDDAVWVTLQLGRGLSRIDPATNTSDGRAGMWPPCWAPVVAFGSVWQAGCDAHQVTRIDPDTLATTDITVNDQVFLVLAGDEVITSGPLGLSRIDPTSNTIATIGGPPGRAVGYAGGTVWVSDETRVFRVDPRTGSIVSSLPITHGGLVTEQDGYAWLVQESTGVLKIDLVTNEVLQLLPVRPDAFVARELAGALWVTAYGSDSLWRIEP